MNNINTIGERIRFVRTKNNINISELAKSVSVDRHTLSQYELGRNMIPSDILGRIAKNLKISTDWLIFGGEDDYEKEIKEYRFIIQNKYTGAYLTHLSGEKISFDTYERANEYIENCGISNWYQVCKKEIR